MIKDKQKTQENTLRFTELAAYKKLKKHYQSVRNLHMRRLFSVDAQRFDKFSLNHKGITLDYSKNRITEDTMNLLFELANESHVAEWRDRMFRGEKINNTENRAVLHTALRSCSDEAVYVDDKDVIPSIKAVHNKMRKFSKAIRHGKWTGYTGRPIRDVVNIGIGGSDLGPKLAYEALKPYRHKRIKVHFISNVDCAHIDEVLEELSPETTLFIISSKSFTTQETLTNAHTARDWVLQVIGDKTLLKKHFVAVSSNRKAVQDFGIDPDHMFEIWDWVGGRYSLWSAIGLSIVISIGMRRFVKMLAGAHAMDEHFLHTPFKQNIPVILALIGIWYNNFFDANSYGILPYDYYLRSLPMYLEQADMESNGKSVDRYGRKVDYRTSPVIWGTSGMNGQHAYYQALHQGTQMIPADFIVSTLTHTHQHDHQEHHDILFANALAQTEALMRGRNEDETYADLMASSRYSSSLDTRFRHMVCEGNHPSNLILIRKLTPRTLGMLIAMYEHKVFVQGIIWQLNSFDQWGVELGKRLAKSILNDIKQPFPTKSHDASTNAIINLYRNIREGK